MLRDARINQIGEGANEVLTSFIALVGMRDPAKSCAPCGTRSLIPGANGPCSAAFLPRRCAASCAALVCRCNRGNFPGMPRCWAA